jgi:hypothetical protein
MAQELVRTVPSCPENICGTFHCSPAPRRYILHDERCIWCIWASCCRTLAADNQTLVKRHVEYLPPCGPTFLRRQKSQAVATLCLCFLVGVPFTITNNLGTSLAENAASRKTRSAVLRLSSRRSRYRLFVRVKSHSHNGTTLE